MVQRQARYVYPVLALSSLLAVLLLELGGVFDTALSLENYRLSISQPLLDALYRIDREDELDYLPPDPYSAPGFLNFDPSNPWEADWQPFDSSFPPSLNWLQVFKDAIVGKPDTPYHSPPPPPPNGREEDLPSKIFNSPEAHHARGSHGPRRHSHPHLSKGSHALPHGHPHHPPPPPPPHRDELLAPFKNTTLLVLGDSVDRGSIKYMSENLGLPIFVAQWEHANDLDHGKYMDNGVNPAYLPHQLWMPAPIDMLITNCFMYGLDDKRDLLDDNPDTKVDRAEDRIEKLCKPYTEQLKYPVSAISLQSGLWDLAYFGRRSVANNISTSTPLTREDMEWWLGRMETMYASVQKSWPGVPIVMRKMQRASAAGAEARYWHKNPGGSGFQNFFTDVRVQQIRNLQEYFAQQHELEIHDFGLHFEGYQEGYSLDVHPNNIPGGIVHNKAFLHYMRRALLSRQRESRS